MVSNVFLAPYRNCTTSAASVVRSTSSSGLIYPTMLRSYLLPSTVRPRRFSHQRTRTPLIRPNNAREVTTATTGSREVHQGPEFWSRFWKRNHQLSTSLESSSALADMESTFGSRKSKIILIEKQHNVRGYAVILCFGACELCRYLSSNFSTFVLYKTPKQRLP